MSRGPVWWGTAPLVVGGAGLVLLAFGAPGMQNGDAINQRAHQEADRVEKQLNDAEQRKEAVAILQNEEYVLKEREGKSVDLQSLAPKKGEEMTPEQAAEAGRRIYDALSDHHDRGNVIAECVAFYAGLVLVFAGGVLLYRRTPDSVRGEW